MNSGVKACHLKTCSNKTKTIRISQHYYFGWGGGDISPCTLHYEGAPLSLSDLYLAMKTLHNQSKAVTLLARSLCTFITSAYTPSTWRRQWAFVRNHLLCKTLPVHTLKLSCCVPIISKMSLPSLLQPPLLLSLSSCLPPLHTVGLIDPSRALQINTSITFPLKWHESPDET